MITGDKVTLKTGAVIDLSGKEGGETYLGGDERGEGKNGIQLAKKTSLEKGSTINVSGKEKGGRAIVWGDIALIDGNINAQGKDIAKTGGFVETSGHDLSIGDDVIVDAKEWLLDPENVSINSLPPERSDNTSEGDEYTTDAGTKESPKRNNTRKATLTNSTLERILKGGSYVNITANNKIYVNSSINLSNGSLTLYTQRDGVEINGDITSNKNGNLTIKAGSWVDVHKNITLGTGFLNITAGDSVAFEGKGNKARNAANAQITAQGTITVNKDDKQFRFNNVSINGTSKGLKFIANQNNFTHKFDGEINISGTVTINQTTHANAEFWRTSKDSFWNVTSLNLEPNANFTFIKFVSGNRSGPTTDGRSSAGVIFNSGNKEMNFNVAQGAKVNFRLKSNENTNKRKPLPHQFKSNITVNGQGSVFFDVYANHSGRGIDFNMSRINVSGGANLTFNSHIRGDSAFKISKDLIINATNSDISILQTQDKFNGNNFPGNAITSTKNITILAGNVTLGGTDSSSSITGTITVNNEANVTLQAENGNGRNKKLTLGNISVNGKLKLAGASADIQGNLNVKQSAKFKAETKNNLNITGTFTNNGTSIIDIKQGVVNIQGNITNEGSLNITTHASGNQKTIINGNITNKKGDLNIKDDNNNAEIQIGGNISQKEGNLTISSDKVNITNQITIKKGVNGESSDSSTESQANLTIKTKELKLVNDLNISGFDKAEITAKNGRDLTIGNSNDGNSGAEAKAVTFNNVKDSKISANGHNVTLNSKVETSGSNDSAQDSSDNNTGLAINAKNVTVNNDITSHKTVNITASEKLTTKADATINATNGNVKVTTQTGDIKGQVKSTSGDVEITASGDTLNVSNVSGSAVTITADKGKLTAQAGSTVSATNGVTASSQSGDIGGTISGKTVNVKATERLTTQKGSKIEATEGEANVTSATGTIGGTVSGDTVNIKATDKLTTQAGSSITSTKGQVDLSARDGNIEGSINAANVTLNTTGTLTTATGSSINAANGNLVINAQDATLNGDASGDRTEVNAVNASGSGNVTAATSSSVNITGDLNTINGLNIISENGRNTVRLRGKEIDVKYIQPGVASVEEVIEAKRVLEKVKDLSDEERETLAKLGVSAVRFIEPNNTITVNTQNEFTTRPSSQVTISEGKACFSSGNGAAVCTNVADDGQQ
ncbi:TPA: beta strand repeat-containing protein [Haemophilus influenzae]